MLVSIDYDFADWRLRQGTDDIPRGRRYCLFKSRINIISLIEV